MSVRSGPVLTEAQRPRSNDEPSAQPDNGEPWPNDVANERPEAVGNDADAQRSSAAADIFSKKYGYSIGQRRDDWHWRTYEATLQDFLDTHFSGGFEVGPKDGKCFAPPLNGERRLANNVPRAYGIPLDDDTGMEMEAGCKKAEDAGLYCLAWHTPSHLKTETEIAESSLVKFAKKKGVSVPDEEDEDALCALCADYLREAKNVVEEITSSISAVSRELRDGMKYVVTHAPMHRVRYLFILEEPFDFTKGGTQAERQKEWKERYAGFAAKAGFAADPACADVARLMYMPRRPHGSNPDLYKIREVKGRAVTLDDMPTLGKERKGGLGGKFAPRGDNPFADAAQELGGGARAEEADTFQTPGLKKFLALAKNCFEIERFLEEQGADFRGSIGMKHHFQCPNDADHSDAGNPDDKGFFVINASDNEETGGFAACCMHASCQSELGTDRGRHLDAACVKYGIAHARELLAWCTEAIEWDAEKSTPAAPTAEEKAKEEEAFAATLDALPNQPNDEQLIVIVHLIASGPNGLQQDSRVGRLFAKIGTKIYKRRTIEDQIKDMRDAAALRQKQAREDAENNTIEARNPVPRDKSQATRIWSTWDYYDQIACAKARLVAMNEKDPQIFRRQEGGVVRLQSVGENIIFSDLDQSYQWVHELCKRMQFVSPSEENPEQGKTGPAFLHVVGDFLADLELPVPLIERVVEVPVFGEDGSLRTNKGYDKASRVLLNPKMKFEDVPDVVTEEDVELAVSWLIEATRDFPFSDDFSGNDPLPVRVPGEVDEEGHPMPNFDRGVSSRTNLFAMILQPFARAMIKGPCPAYLIDKSMPGTGAGFLADVAGSILYGEKMTCGIASTEEEELRKEIMSRLREGATTIFLDNINHKLDNASLASALTAGKMQGRILGSSTTYTASIKATWIFAANNGKFSEELMRRTVPIRMDAATPNPELRPPSFFKHPDLHGWLLKNRADLVWSCQVLVRNWIQEGRPDGKKVLASFERYSRVMGGILAAANVEGFLENCEDYRDTRKDDGNEGLRAYVNALLGAFGAGTEFTPEEATTIALNKMTGEPYPQFGFQFRQGQNYDAAIGRVLSDVLGQAFKTENGNGVQLGKRRTNKGVRYVLHVVDGPAGKV